MDQDVNGKTLILCPAAISILICLLYMFGVMCPLPVTFLTISDFQMYFIKALFILNGILKLMLMYFLESI